MADGIAGLLDAQGNIDLTKIRGLLAPQPTDRREAALLMGLGLLGTRGGQEGEAFQRAAAMGLTSQQQAMRQRQESIQSAAQIMQMQRFAQQMADEQKARQIMAGIPLAGMQQPTGGLPQPFPAPGGGSATAMMNAGLGSAPPPTTMLPTQQPAATGGGITKKQVSDYYAAAAMQFSRAGLPGQAKDALEMAVKNQPEVLHTEVGTDPVTKQPIIFNVFKDGGSQVLPYLPEEKIHWGSTQERANIPFSDRTAEQLGPGMPQGISQYQRGELGIRGGELGVRQQELGIKQKEFDRGKWVNLEDRGLQVDMATGQTRPITKENAAEGAVSQAPIGPKNIEQKVTEAKGRVEMADRVLGMIDKATPRITQGTTGLVGSWLGKVPGSEAYDLRGTVDSIKANLGFEQLSALRAASPTGGALGQVSDMENKMLQATVANLDANQSREQVLANVAQVRQHLSNVRDLIAQTQSPQVAAAVQAMPKSSTNKRIKFSDLNP